MKSRNGNVVCIKTNFLQQLTRISNKKHHELAFWIIINIANKYHYVQEIHVNFFESKQRSTIFLSMFASRNRLTPPSLSHCVWKFCAFIYNLEYASFFLFFYARNLPNKNDFHGVTNLTERFPPKVITFWFVPCERAWQTKQND